MMTRLVSTTASKLIIRSQPVQGANSDTGKRLLAGQIAMSFGESWDKEWQYIAAPNGTGWASSEYLQAVTDIHPSKRLLYTLDGEDPQLTASIEKLQQLANAEGIEFTTADFGGVRTEADTVRILKYRDDDYAAYVRNLKATKPRATPVPKTTWRPINPFGTSMHNFGCARDLKIIRKPASFSEAEALHRLGALAPICGLRWGGTFKRPDPPHMELPITLAEAKRRYEARAQRFA